jgi:hypothetical protein
MTPYIGTAVLATICLAPLYLHFSYAHKQRNLRNQTP